MADWTPIVGLSFQPKDFETYCKSLHWTTWRPSFIVLHNTFNPNLTLRPKGLTKANIDGLVGYYKNSLKWSAGPHLFIDDLQIWVFTPLTHQGVHSPSWNNFSLGVEMLGDYDTDSFSDGRGLRVRKNVISALSILSRTLGFPAESLRLHKEDPKTTHKNCPGKFVIKEEVIGELQQEMMNNASGEHPLKLVI